MDDNSRLIPCGRALYITDDLHPERGGIKVDEKIMRDHRMSASARGALVGIFIKYMDSNQPVQVSDLRCGKQRLIPYLKELEKFGYVREVK